MRQKVVGKEKIKKGRRKNKKTSRLMNANENKSERIQ